MRPVGFQSVACFKTNHGTYGQVDHPQNGQNIHPPDGCIGVPQSGHFLPGALIFWFVVSRMNNPGPFADSFTLKSVSIDHFSPF
jgi:hypothetical protein